MGEPGPARMICPFTFASCIALGSIVLGFVLVSKDGRGCSDNECRGTGTVKLLSLCVLLDSRSGYRGEIYLVKESLEAFVAAGHNRPFE